MDTLNIYSFKLTNAVYGINPSQPLKNEIKFQSNVKVIQ